MIIAKAIRKKIEVLPLGTTRDGLISWETEWIIFYYSVRAIFFIQCRDTFVFPGSLLVVASVTGEGGTGLDSLIIAIDDR